MDLAEPRASVKTTKSNLGLRIRKLFGVIRDCFMEKNTVTNQSIQGSQWDPNSLKSGVMPPKERMTGSSAELRALEQTLALMNNANVTGAQVPAEEAAQMKQTLRKPVLPPVATPVQTVESAPVEEPKAAEPKPLRIVLTGRSGSGKDYIAGRVPRAWVAHLDDPIFEYVKGHFRGIQPNSPGCRDLMRSIWLWGKGYVTDRLPLNVARLLFMMSTPDKWREHGFGQPEFWANLFVDGLAAAGENRQIIVAGVTNGGDYNALRRAGFKHYHVMCSAATYNMRPKDTARADQIAADLDGRITKEISERRNGPRLNCVWNDVTIPPSSRLFTLEQWINEVSL